MSGPRRNVRPMPAGSPIAVQLSVEDLGTALADATFVVVDLETTGARAKGAQITEIGAVRVRGGEVLGEFQTFVNPGVPIPSFISTLTGITNDHVRDAPSVASAVTAFVEFAGNAYVVAHNAGFDMSFLRAACAEHQITWQHAAVIDTVRLARTALHRDEVRNCKLETLARHFHTAATPCHRALDDARATAEVLHHLFERLGSLGVSTIEDLRAFVSPVAPVQRTKRHLADHVPHAPGVYIFRDMRGEALYIGTSRDLRSRVRSYFTASETRRGITQMLEIAQRVETIVCATALEASIRERRLIVSEQPRFNRRSRTDDSPVWIALTNEPAPRLVVQTGAQSPNERLLFGPVSSRATARLIIEALQDVFAIRTCTSRLAKRPTSPTPGCIRAELKSCAAPCFSGGDFGAYTNAIAEVREALKGDMREALARVQRRMQQRSLQERYEEAAVWREQLGRLVSASVRHAGWRAIASHPQIVAASPVKNGWDIHVIRYGMLAGAAHAPAGSDPRPMVDHVVASAAHVDPDPSGLPAGLVAECLDIARWLESARLLSVSDGAALAWPLHCGGQWLERTTIEIGYETQGYARPQGPRRLATTRLATTPLSA